MPVAKSVADIQILKSGAAGRPVVSVVVDAGVALDKLTYGIQKGITRNVELRKKLGLKACASCISGMDIDIRHRYDIELQVDLNQLG